MNAETNRKSGTISGSKVLLVDDVLLNRTMAKILLQDWGCEVSEAEDGVAAVEAVLSGAFNVVLMDIQMPKMDGVEATRKIREAGIEIPIVGVTANAFSEQRETYLEAGMIDVVPKPIDWDALHELITGLMPNNG